MKQTTDTKYTLILNIQRKEWFLETKEQNSNHM